MKLLMRRERETGREFALRNLRENIIHLELKPGSMVSENELAAQMGLSRTPVREALMELAKVRLVDVYPQRGSAVALIDYDLVEEARFMRNVLECAVVELACHMATPADKADLERNILWQEQELAPAPLRRARLWALDAEFHQMLFRSAKKAQTFEILKSFTVHFDRVRNMSLTLNTPKRTVKDHRDIMEAVLAGDADRAKAIMTLHLSRYKVDESELRIEYPKEYFKLAQ